LIYFLTNITMEEVQHIGPPVERVLSYDETCALTWPEDTTLLLQGHAGPNEHILIPIEAHKAVIKKIQEDANSYSTQKSYGAIGRDMTVVQDQLVKLINLAQYAVFGGNETALMVLLSASLCLQFIIFSMTTMLAKSKTEKVNRCCMATGLNSMVTILIWISLMVAFAITALTRITGPIIIAPNGTLA